MGVFKESFGWLIKCTETGYIDTESQYPVCSTHVKNTPLVDGYEWVKVKLSYSEVVEENS